MNDFYGGKTVVVTGGMGMIGVQLVRQLKEAGAQAVVVDDGSRGNNYVEGTIVHQRDSGNPDAMTSILDYYGDVFAIFNLAARVAGVHYNSAHHHEMFNENVRLLTNPLIAAEAYNVPHYLQTSSVCVYSPVHNHPSVERDGTVGHPHPANAGYSWAKRMGEQAVLWSNLEHAVIVRPSNVYGPHDYFDKKAHVIPSLIKKMLAPGDTLTMISPPTISREFIYSTDVAAGMMTALAYGEHKGVYNIGTNGDTCLTIAEMASTIMSLCGVQKQVLWQTKGDPGDPARWSNARKLNGLGWSHTVGMVDGLQEVIDEYRSRTEET